jgi:ERCC4-type nuclease
MSARTALPFLHVWYDTREQDPFEPIEGVTLERVSLPTGDYTTERLQLVAVIERKSILDFASSITHGRDRLDSEIDRMKDYKWRAIIVEGSIDAVWRERQIHPHSVIGTVASFLARHDVPVLFAGTRVAAARMAFGCLRRWEERLLAERSAAE